MALIDAQLDKDSNVRDVVGASLRDLGSKQTSLVLTSCLNYLSKHVKLPVAHKIAILNCMADVVRANLEKVDKELAIAIVKEAATQMTQTKDAVPEWQAAASHVLVAVGCQWILESNTELIKRFNPGQLPDFFIVETMGNLAKENVYGMVPYIKAGLSTMLSVIGIAKQDNIRWIFAYTISRFCEAILDYCANMDNFDSDPNVNIAFYSDEIDVIHEVLLNNWIGTRDAKIREQVIEAVGQMSYVVSKPKLQERLPKLLQTFSNLYKKHPEPFHVSKGLYNILDANSSDILHPHVESILQAIFPQVCHAVDYSVPMTIKNHNELLRCLSVLVRVDSMLVVMFLMEKLENSNERVRIGVLSIMRHLINSAGEEMADKKDIFISGLKKVTGDPNNKVKKILAQTIIAMAHHGYLQLVGGQEMIEFIVNQCALPTETPGRRPTDPEYVSNDALRSMCDNVLQLLTTTVDNMGKVLWPFLLECVIPEKYTMAQSTICRCIAHTAAKKKEENDDSFYVDFDASANVPKPQALLARFFVLCGLPVQSKHRGLHALTALRWLAPLIHENLIEMWDIVIPKLIKHLEDHQDLDDWSQNNWEDLMLKFVSKSLEQVGDEEWICSMGDAMAEQISLYDNLHDEKNFLYKCLGIIMRISSKKDFVSHHLDTLFSTVKHANQVEREGCAVGLGYAAASHLDIVTTKLDLIAKRKSDSTRKSGILSFIKDFGSGSELDDQTKATILLCYGYVALYAPPHLIISRLQTQILVAINPHLTNAKLLLLSPPLPSQDPDVKQNLIRTIELIGRSMHPEHLNARHDFSHKNKLLQHLQDYIKAESPTQVTGETRYLAFKAMCVLVQLTPRLMSSELAALLQNVLDASMQLPPLPPNADAKDSELLLSNTLKSLQQLLLDILSTEMTTKGLDIICTALQPWRVSSHSHERERAMELSLKIYHHFLQGVDVVSVSSLLAFCSQGSCLGRIVPRCSDPQDDVRESAFNCIYTLLKIKKHAYFSFPRKRPDYSDPFVESVNELKHKIDVEDSAGLFEVISQLAEVLRQKLSSDQLMPFLQVLMEGLVDAEPFCSSGACVVMKSFMESRGAELHSQVATLQTGLHAKLSVITHPQTRTGTLRAVRALGKHHMLTMLEHLMQRTLPLDAATLDTWKVIGQKASLTAAFMETALEMLRQALPYEERSDKERVIRSATQHSMALTVVLTELCKGEEAAPVVASNYARLLASMMTMVSSMVDVRPPQQQAKDANGKPAKHSSALTTARIDPSEVSIDGLRQVLIASQCPAIMQALDSVEIWGKFRNIEQVADGFALLTKCLVEFQPHCIGHLVSNLNPLLGASVYDPQRMMAAAVYAQVISERSLIEEGCAGDSNLVDLLVNGLLARLVDSNHRVRMLCIRGLGNVASAGSEQLRKYSMSVVSAMIAGMDDKEDVDDYITLEAMEGLSRILAEIDEEQIRGVLINVSLRIRPCFEKNNDRVRAVAIGLFGDLARFGDGPSKDPFVEQIHSNLVTLLLHLNDPSPQVRLACKKTLRSIGPFVGSEAINEMFQKHLLESASLIYGEFMNDLSKAINKDFVDKLNFYTMGNVSFFRSSWSEIRSNAAMFVGFLLGNMDSSSASNLSKEHICGALILLLKDLSPDVRIKAAEAMSYLHCI
ncbi:hypothetical protein CAPTEDRAFT_173785 [Capitella teleta]|uniref:Maestro heat-like repeat-containing protein family member 1 n=1 Tax=Capitella teleta TaxID=283909 RepID=R7TJ37_CAPTE|nr:hypothetical protein CAPTEDRAFT_173785 [Capitella teleta]|eukprot:ELT91566.1 hypothetical protein CAPTEDRAFT_173785 [Capitella teleta]